MLVIGSVEAVLTVGGQRPSAVAVVPALAVPLIWRRSRPATVAVIVACALAVQQPWPAIRSFDQTFTGFVCLLVAAYALGRHAQGRDLIVAGAMCALAPGVAIGLHDADVASGALAVMLVLASVGVGRTVQDRVRLRMVLEAQARELDAAAEVGRRASVLAVRSGIAGECRRVVSERVGDMVVQTQGARRLTATDPARATEMIASVEASGRDALDQMRRMLGVLRPGDEPVQRTAPAPATVAHATEGFIDPRGGTSLGRYLPSADRWLTVAVVAVLLAESMTASAPGRGTTTALAAACAACLIGGPLLARRSYPLTAAAVGWSAVCVMASFWPLPAFSLALVLALYSYSAGAYARNRAWTGLVVGVAGVSVANLMSGTAQWGDYAFPVVLVGLAWLGGAAVRQHTSMVSEVMERARQLEQARAARATAARVGERLRLARELHDVVAHTLMVMVVQAGAARRTLQSGRVGSFEALDVVEDAGRAALVELRRLLSLVESVKDPLSPLPGMGQLSALVERTRAAGLRVDLRIGGRPHSLPGGLDLAAYRVVQEALTNVLRHADATRAWVCVDYQPDRLVLEIGDDGRARPPGSCGRAGNGIVGMRERVRIHGGELVAGPQPAGGFLVSATILFGLVGQGLPA